MRLACTLVHAYFPLTFSAAAAMVSLLWLLLTCPSAPPDRPFAPPGSQRYVKIFQDVEIFPEAKTLLAATCEANNRNATDAAVENYKREMDARFGIGKRHVPEGSLKKHHTACRDGSLGKFWHMATIGPMCERSVFANKVEEHMASSLRNYLETNRERDPWKNIEPFLVPLAVAFSAYLSRVFTDLFCFEPVTPHFDWEASDVCSRFSGFLVSALGMRWWARLPA